MGSRGRTRDKMRGRAGCERAVNGWRMGNWLGPSQTQTSNDVGRPDRKLQGLSKSCRDGRQMERLPSRLMQMDNGGI